MYASVRIPGIRQGLGEGKGEAYGDGSVVVRALLIQKTTAWFSAPASEDSLLPITVSPKDQTPCPGL